MPERMAKWLTGVARRHPETVRMALLSTCSVKLLGVGATAPDWCAVLCSRVDQCQGGDFQGLGSGSPCGSRKAADQGNTCSGLRTEVFQVLAKRQRTVQFHTQVSWCRLELQPVAVHGDVDLAVSFPAV